MCEMLVVKFRQSLPIVDGFTHDKHGGQREMIVVNDIGEVFQFSAIYFSGQAK